MATRCGRLGANLSTYLFHLLYFQSVVSVKSCFTIHVMSLSLLHVPRTSLSPLLSSSSNVVHCGLETSPNIYLRFDIKDYYQLRLIN
jgi:hypothetical protein